MLILSRRVGETIVIGDNITLTVLGFKGNQVRLGIVAPGNVSVHRQEVYERVTNAQQQQAGANVREGHMCTEDCTKGITTV